MQIKLYVNSADTRVCNKAPYLSTIATLDNCRPLDPCSVVQPVISVDWSNTYRPVNYVYVSDFNKYYFVTDRVVTAGGRCILYLDADDRYNWYDFYKNKSAVIIRSEKIGKPTEIIDTKLPIDPNRHTLLTLPILKNGASPFAASLNDCSVVLTNVGNVKQNPIT